MLRSYWRRHSKTIAVGALLVVVALFLLFWGIQIGGGLGRYGADNDYYSGKYPADTKARIDQCFLESPPASSEANECVTEAIKSGRESQRSEDDLSAQKEMAWWARAMFVISAIQIPISIVGILALLETIRQGQKAIKMARKANKISYLAVKIEHTPVIKISPHGEFLHSQNTMSGVGAAMEFKGKTPSAKGFIKIENLGKEHVSIILACVYLRGHPMAERQRYLIQFMPKQQIFLTWWGLVDTLDPLSTFGPIEFPDDQHAAELIINSPPVVTGYIVYDDVLSIRRRKRFAFKPNGFANPTRYDLWGGDAENCEEQLN